MIHLRTASDAVPPAGAASRRALTSLRTASDEAPGGDGAPRVIVIEIPMCLFGLFTDIELMLMCLEYNVEARGPPCR